MVLHGWFLDFGQFFFYASQGSIMERSSFFLKSDPSSNPAVGGTLAVMPAQSLSLLTCSLETILIPVSEGC